MKKTKVVIAIILCFVLAVSLLSGCTGAPGKDGATGKDGAPGKDGANGLAPHIGVNGNWWIGEQDTNVKAMGENSVTPEMFGAVGDGVADDTAAVLNALKTGQPVFLCNRYRVTELDCTGLTKIVMYGKEDVTTRLSTVPVAEDTYNIIFEGAELFKNAPERLSLEQIRLYAKNAGILINTRLRGGWVKKCNFTNFGGVFMDGMHSLSQISENVFVELQGTLSTQCVDSIITNNYIKAALSKRITLFTGPSFAGILFQGNFVDCCKVAFGEYQNWTGNRIEGNTFKSVFRVFDIKYALSNTEITGNYFSQINEDGLAEFGEYADSQMRNQEWTAITISQKCNSVDISDNVGETTIALKMQYNVNDPRDTYINLAGVKGKIEFGYYNKENTEGSSVFVKDLDYITVDGDSLPSAALYDASGNPLTSFNKQHIFWQGNLYINNNGAWVKLSNNG